MKHLYKFTFLLLTVLFIACKENLPDPTQNGSNTIACKVNGKAWIAEVPLFPNNDKFSVLYSNLYKPRKRFALFATRLTDKEHSNIILAVSDLKTTGTQYFSSDTTPLPDNPRYENHASYIEYKPNELKNITNSHYTGSITFTRVDTLSRVFAGTFEFTAENSDGSGQTVKVTDGRFDIKY